VVTRDGRRPTLWAIRDPHNGHNRQQEASRSRCIRPHPDDGHRKPGDARERTAEIHWSTRHARKRFCQVIWVPGQPRAVDHQPRSDADLRQGPLLNPCHMCDEMGIGTQEHPVPSMDREGRPGDNRCRCYALRLHLIRGMRANLRKREWQSPVRQRCVGTDEFLCQQSRTHSTSMVSRRVSYTRKRLEDLDWYDATVVVKHFPMVRRTLTMRVSTGVLAVGRQHGEARWQTR